MRKKLLAFALLICFSCGIYAQEEDVDTGFYDEVNEQYTHQTPTSVNFGASASNESNLNNFLLNAELFNTQKITPNPNESVDLFSGSLKLSYTDFSAPVAPGLDLEFNRTYNLDHFATDVFIGDKNFAQNHVSQVWNFQSDYILVYNICFEKIPSNACKPVYVTSKGQKILLYADKDKAGQFRTVNNWHGVIESNGFVLTAPNGFKYSFKNSFTLATKTRYYLTKIETPSGHYIIYTYDRTLLKEITTSNPNQKLKVYYQQYQVKDKYKKHWTMYAPIKVSYNGRDVAYYHHDFKIKNAILVFTSAGLPDGRYWNYDYGLTTWGREILTSVYDAKGNSKYLINTDNTLAYSAFVEALRLVQITRTEGGVSNTWTIHKSTGVVTNGRATKLVTVTNDYYTMVNKYFGFEHNNVWQAGLLTESRVYKGHKVSSDEVLQKIEYSWLPVLHNHEKNKISLYMLDDKVGNRIDDKTYRTVPQSITLTRGNDIYKTEYFDYDNYDNAGRIIHTTNNKTRETKQEFLNIVDKNILGLRTKLSVNNKVINQQEYDDVGNVVKSSSFNRHNTYAYNNGLLISDTDTMGNTIYYKNHYAGVPQDISYPDDTQESKIINAYGQPDSITNVRKNTTGYLYDYFGRVVKQMPAIGLETSYNYLSGNVTSKHGNYTETTVNNSYNLPIKKTLGSKKEIIYRYDAMGRKIFQSFISPPNQAASSGHSYTYDSLNRITSDCYVTGNKTDNCTKYIYSDNNTTAVYYPTGEYKITTSFGYGSPEHAKIIHIKEDGRETTIARDDLDYVAEIKQGKVIKSYSYDKDYNLIKYSEPETGTTIYKHDQLGNVIEKDQGSNKTQYQYDKKNYRLTNVKYSDNNSPLSYEYYEDGSIKKAVKGRVAWDYKYDEVDRLTNEDLNIQGVITLKVANKFNQHGHLERIIYPDQTEYFLNPDEYGQPTSIGAGITNINYHPNGHWQQMMLGTAKVSSSLDIYKRVNQYNYGTLNLNYIYDLNNNLLEMKLSDSADESYKHGYNFAYDKMGRIISAKLSNGEVNYAYDDNDNLLSIKSTLTNLNGSKNNSSHTSLSPTMSNDLIFSYNNMQLISIAGENTPNTSSQNKITFGYDDLGNIKADSHSKYNYSVDGNLQSMSGKYYGTYEYDYNQQRVYQEIKTLKGTEKIVTFYNKSGLALYDYNITKNKTNKYLYLNSQRVSKITSDIKEAVVQNNVHSYYYNDAQGSPLAEIDEKGKTLWREAYLPFGAKLLNDIDTNLNKFGFIGKEMDESGLSYFGARYYNPISGRFIAPDPAEVKPENPFTFNRYAYGYNNPYKYVDPDGREVAPPPVMLAEFILGGAAGAWSGYYENGFKGAAVGFVAGGVSSVAGSFLSGKAAGALAARALFTRKAASFGTEVLTNTAGSMISSRINTGNAETKDALPGAMFGAISNSLMHRYGVFTPKNSAEAFGIGKYASVGSITMESMYNNIKRNSIAENKNSYNGVRGKIDRR